MEGVKTAANIESFDTVVKEYGGYDGYVKQVGASEAYQQLMSVAKGLTTKEVVDKYFNGDYSQLAQQMYQNDIAIRKVFKTPEEYGNI